MHLEVAILSAKDGDAAGLVNAMRNGGEAALESCPGCTSAKVYPGIENPGNVLFLVKWNSVAGPWFGGPDGGSMQHFDLG
jgi:hypothetical protein